LNKQSIDLKLGTNNPKTPRVTRVHNNFSSYKVVLSTPKKVKNNGFELRKNPGRHEHQRSNIPNPRKCKGIDD